MTFERFSLVLAAGLVIAGCGNKDTTPTTTAKTTPATLSPAFFGTKVAPLGPLAKITWGMPAAEARKAAPELFPKQNGKYNLSPDAKLAKVSYGVGIDDHQVIDRMVVELPEDARAMIDKAWGPGKPAKDSIGTDRTYWFDPAGGWRAYLSADYPGTINLELRPYLPVAKLLGDGPGTLGFAPDGILGASLAELRTRFGSRLIETDAATAAAQQKEVSKFSGIDLDKRVGKAKPSVRVDLPTTEWDEFWTRVQITWSDDGKVEGVWFSLPYGAYGPAKAELAARFETKWGKPQPGKYLASDVQVFHAKDPWIAVEDDTITHAWTVHVAARPPRF